MSISRRGVLFGLPLLLAGCASSGIGQQRLNYAAKPDEKFPLPEMHLEKVKPELRRQEVAYDTAHPAGTVIVDTPARRLYYVLGDGRAMRYGVGVGRQGLALKGDAYIGRKSEWPSWTPTANMMRRDPRNLKYAGGMEGGLTIRSAHGRSTSIAAATTPCSVCTAPTSRNPSATPCQAAVSGC